MFNPKIVFREDNKASAPFKVIEASAQTPPHLGSSQLEASQQVSIAALEQMPKPVYVFQFR